MNINEVVCEQFRPTTLAAMLADMEFANQHAGIENAVDGFYMMTLEALVNIVGSQEADALIAEALDDL